MYHDSPNTINQILSDEPSKVQMDALLDDLDRTEYLFIRDKSQDKDWVSYEKIRDRDDVEFLVKNNHVHPEAVGLVVYQYQIAGTINYGPLRLRSDSDRGETAREEVIRKLMNRFRIALNIRGKDFIWIATTEYGYGNRPHGHFLISFDKTSESFSIPEVDTIKTVLNACLFDLAKETEDPCIGDMEITPVTNSMGACSYLCKKEYRRPFKAFYFSTGLIKRS